MNKGQKNKRYNSLRIALDVIKQMHKPSGVSIDYLMKKYGLSYQTGHAYINAVMDGDTEIRELENVDDNYQRKHYGYLQPHKKPEYINLKDVMLSRAKYTKKCFKPKMAVLFIRDLVNAEIINRQVVQSPSDKEYSYIKYSIRVPNSKVYEGVAHEDK